MNGLTTMRVGPTAAGLYNLQARWASQPFSGDARQASISGDTTLLAAHQLAELVANPELQVTIGRATGVLVPIHFDGRVADQFIGWYLLEAFSFDPYRIGDQVTHAGFSLSGAYLGPHPEVVVSRSARARANDFDLDGQALVVNPFWGEDPDGEPFVVPPGGTFFTREYDPTSPHDSTRLTPADEARQLGMYAGAVDELAPVVLPDLEAATDYDGQAVPRWVTDRGGDCRAYDRREEREVFGPSHPLVAPTDLVITNGLLRAWVGARGLPPYLQVQAFAAGEWREIGYLQLSDPTEGSIVLTSARLVRVTPEAVSIAIGLQGQGEALLTLRRGERMFQVQHGGARTRLTATRQVSWSGVPPWRRLEAAAQGVGKFGKGLDAGRDDVTWDSDIAMWDDPGYSWDGAWANPDLRLHWPAAAAGSSWTMVVWYRPAGDVADLDGAGLLTVYDVTGARAFRLRLDSADSRFHFELGDDDVESAVQTFAAGDHIFIVLRFSTDDGMSLSVKAGASALAHVHDASAVDPGDDPYRDIFFGISESTWGSGTWGSGTWGGVSWADGVEDNIMIFDDRLTDAEVAALAAATGRLDGLPSPESRLVWHLPGDARLVLAKAALASGLTYETAGASRAPDDWGLTKGLAVLTDDTVEAPGLAVQAYTEQFSVAAFLATTDAEDDLADHHEQFAVASEQEVRVR